MPILPKKLLIFLLVVLVFPLFTLTAPPKTYALTKIYSDLDLEEYVNTKKQVRDAKTNNQENDMIVGQEVKKYDILSSMGALAEAAGPICMDPNVCPLDGTAMGSVAQAFELVYANPPARFAWYMNDTLAHAGLVKPAYAQGIGFSGLIPLLGAWKAIRNISYIVIILILVVIGFMIIFRMKIDPKTVIGIQAALPKIVVTLILITLSYAIVGFLIDIMYLAIALVVTTLTSAFGPQLFANGTDTTARYLEYYMTGHIGALFTQVFTAGGASINDFFVPMGASIGATGIGVALADLIARNLIMGPWGFALSVVPSLLVLLIIILGLLFTFIRLLIILINGYIQVLINLILAPLILLQEAIPGKSAFGNWIKTIMANLVVFPATAAVLIFAKFLTTLNEHRGMWTPPLIFPGGEGTYNVFTGFLGLAVVFMAPTLVVQVKKMFAAKPALPITTGTALAPLTGAFQTTMGAASQFYYANQMLNMLPGRQKAPGGGH